MMFDARVQVRPERRETIGSPEHLGGWICETSAEDLEAGAKFRNPKVPTVRRERAPNAPNAPGSGEGLFFHALQARGDLGDEVGPGKWAIRCPREHEHSRGEAFDTSTVLFAPGAEQELGRIHCSHSGCGHDRRGATEWLGEFSREELAAAREAAGLPPSLARGERDLAVGSTGDACAVDSGEDEEAPPESGPAWERAANDSVARRPWETWKTPAERALALGRQGELIPTGISTLDRATRGGLRTGKLVVVAGAPGAGKTGLCVDLAYRWVQAGHFVTILAADEDADGLLIRWGQLAGLCREDLEAGNETARRVLAERLEAIPNLSLVDAEEPGACLETAVEELTIRAGGKPGIIIADSLQTIRAEGTDAAKEKKARADATVKALKRAAKRGHLVLATCEVARGAYRSHKDRIDDLAAFKESGDIEYGLSLGLVLRTVPGAANLVDVAMPKNRTGTREPFRLRIDYDRAAFSEVELPPEPAAAASPAQKFEALREQIVRAVRESPTPFRNRTELANRSGVGKQRALDAIRELFDEGRLVEVGGQVRVRAPE